MAIKQILSSTYSDIAYDHVVLKKFKCFFQPTCRKSFDSVNALVDH